MTSSRGRQFLCGAIVASTLAVGPPEAAGNPASEALRKKAANATYNLDHDLALATFKEAVAADPQDPGAYRGLAVSLWLTAPQLVRFDRRLDR